MKLKSLIDYIKKKDPVIVRLNAVTSLKLGMFYISKEKRFVLGQVRPNYKGGLKRRFKFSCWVTNKYTIDLALYFVVSTPVKPYLWETATIKSMYFLEELQAGEYKELSVEFDGSEITDIQNGMVISLKLPNTCSEKLGEYALMIQHYILEPIV